MKEHVYKHTHTLAHTYTYTHLHTYTHIYTDLHTHTHTHTHTRTNTHTHTHTHTCINTLRSALHRLTMVTHGILLTAKKNKEYTSTVDGGLEDKHIHGHCRASWSNVLQVRIRARHTG